MDRKTNDNHDKGSTLKDHGHEN